MRSRVRRTGTGASTRTTASNCVGSSASNSSGMSFTTIASPRSAAALWSSRRRCCTAGCTMAFSAVSARSSPMTLPRNAARSSEPSDANTSVPNRPAIAARTALPGACASRTSASASMIVAPHFRKRSTTVDLPAAMLPVRATLSTGNVTRETGHGNAPRFPFPVSRFPITAMQFDLHLVWERDDNAGTVPRTTRDLPP